MKTTLETSGEDVKTTLETSGEDVKTKLETSGEDVKTTLVSGGEDYPEGSFVVLECLRPNTFSVRFHSLHAFCFHFEAQN